MSHSLKLFLTAILLLVSSTSLASGHFLEASEIEKMTPHPLVPGSSRYVTPGASTSNYDRILVGSVTFYFSEKSKAKDIDADEMKKISDVMKAALVSAAMDKAEVVVSPGPTTVLFNVAITNINMQNKKRGLLGYTPLGLITSTASNLAGLRVRLRDASLQGEAVDSLTGDVIAVFQVDELGNFDGKKSLSWEDLRATFEDAASKGIAAARAKVGGT